MHKLKDLKVYQKALKFTKVVRTVTKKFPKDELFVLTAQFKRAGDSIALNISEGAGNSSNKEFARFLDYSIRSGFECIGCADIALENEFINQSDYENVISTVNEIIAMLDGLKKSLIR
ncbi:MAG: four helix bundle protein [Ignavibacteriae bacterium]|nr:four helix bundle protein [Ignavibacteriota bacterium]